MQKNNVRAAMEYMAALDGLFPRPVGVISINGKGCLSRVELG